MRRRGLASTAAVAVVAAGCGHPLAPVEHEQHPCDPRGPGTPRDPEQQLEQYAAQELFADEADLLRDPACAVEPRSEEEDASLKRGCVERVGTKPERAACRHACLIGARVAAARAAFRSAVDGLGQVRSRFESERARCVPAHSGRDLWICLGLPALPPRFVIEMQATKTELVRAVVRGDLLPGTLPLAVEAADEDEGCGYHTWSVHTAR